MQNKTNTPTKSETVKVPVTPKADAFAPLLLCGICMLLGLVAVIIDRFIFPFSHELLSPVICQVLILILPMYLYTSATAPSRSPGERLRALGVTGLKAEYIFFLIFAAAFTVCSSFALDILFGGTHVTAEGFTLLGVLTAGDGEHAFSVPYLLLCYAFVPAFAEEIFFRGIIFKEFESHGFIFAATISSLISAVFAYSPGQIPSALLSGVVLSVALSVTGSLFACILIHLIFNVYGIFLQPNLSQYFLSSQSNALLIIILLLTLTASSALFFGELARIHRRRAANGERSRRHLPLKASELTKRAREYFAHRPTLIVSILCALVYIATFVIRILA